MARSTFIEMHSIARLAAVLAAVWLLAPSAGFAQPVQTPADGVGDLGDEVDDIPGLSDEAAEDAALLTANAEAIQDSLGCKKEK
jgi:hypothetical protein